jgi:hypothetical protein
MGRPGPRNDGGHRVIHPDCPCDIALLARNADDTALNTNAGLTSGAGRVISEGTIWKNIYSGATQLTGEVASPMPPPGYQWSFGLSRKKWKRRPVCSAQRGSAHDG